MKLAAWLFVAIASISWNTARAEDLSSEIGPTTVWFALLVVVFALLVAVGLYLAIDRESGGSPRPAARQKVPIPLKRRLSVDKQKEFS